MVILDVFYVALATIAVVAVLQLVTFVLTRMMYPPEPKVIYREVQVPMPPPPPSQPEPPLFTQNGPAFTQPQQQQVELPQYEPRKPASDSLRVDPELPAGLQETRPPGT
jgi:hypothetical protein